jgi:hypothetical protein
MYDSAALLYKTHCEQIIALILIIIIRHIYVLIYIWNCGESFVFNS